MVAVGKQQQWEFFDPTPNRRMPHRPAAPTEDQVNAYVDNSPLREVITSKDNRGNLDTLKTFAFTGRMRYTHSLRGCNFGIYCPPGQGKTFIVKRLAEAIDLPFCFVQSPNLGDTWDLFQQICKAVENFGRSRGQEYKIVPCKTKQADYVLPPVLVFFDEAHYLKEALQKGALLNAMEPDDGYLHVREPGTKGETFVVDCYNVCWSAATTDRGDLFDAFESRLPTPVKWVPAGAEELPQIIHAGLDRKARNGELSLVPPMEVCQEVVRYRKVPRLAIHGFGTQVVQVKQQHRTMSWQDVCRKVAERQGIDRWGLDRGQVAILSGLGQRPIAEGRLGNVAQCRTEEVRRYLMPGLMHYMDGGPYAVSLTGRGMCITRAGLQQLELRGISHRGEKVTAEYFEGQR